MHRPAILFLLLPAFLALACDPGPSTPAGPPAPGPGQAPSGSALSGQAPSGKPSPTPPGQASAAAKVDVGPAAVDAIHLYTGGAREGERVPLVVAIHGLGDKPASFVHLFDGFGAKAHLVVPAGGLPWGDGFAWWPIHGHIDEQNMAAGLGAAADRLAAALPAWQAQGAPGKPVVTGFSQGGMLSFALAAKYPTLIGEAVPVSGLLPTPMLPAAWPASAPKPRLLALHGDADARVPFALGQKSAEGLRALGLTVEFKSYPGVGHTITPEMRKDLLAALEAAAARAAATR